jgi:hypothetical protein
VACKSPRPPILLPAYNNWRTGEQTYKQLCTGGNFLENCRFLLIFVMIGLYPHPYVKTCLLGGWGGGGMSCSGHVDCISDIKFKAV